ncbi:MAG: hypothetical protein JWP75_2911 [Frondihabitans sp.]|nr:hypothetical protein [Frondihabitans sp.]
MEHLLNVVRGFAVTTVLAVTSLLVVGAWFVSSMLIDADRFGWGQSPAHLDVSKIDDDLTRADTEALLARTADSHGVDIALLVPDINGDDERFEAFIFKGAPGDNTLAGRPFDVGMKVVDRPASALRDENLLGVYATTATGTTLDAVGSALRAGGLEVDTTEMGPLLLPLFTLEDPGRKIVLVTTILSCALALAGESLRRQRRHAVQRVNGWSRLEMVRREAKDFTLLFVALLAPTVAVAVATAGLYNGFAASDRLWPQLALTWAGSGFILLVAHVAVATWPSLSSTPQILAGAAPGTVRTAVPLVVQATVVVVACLGVSEASAAIDEGATAKAALSGQSNLAHGVRLGLGAAWGRGEDESIDTALGSAVRGQLRANEAVLAEHEFSLPPGLPFAPNYPNGPDGTNSMIINRAYLAQLGVAGESEAPVTLPHQRSDTIDLLLPDNLTSERTRIEQEFHEWFTFQKELGGVLVDSMRIRVHLIASDQVTPDLSDEENLGLTPRVNNVLAVLPDDAGPASTTFLSLAAGNGQMIFLDPDSLKTAIEERGQSDSVLSYTRFGDSLHRQLALAQGQIDRLSAAVVITFAVLALAIGMSVAHHGVRKRPQRRVLVRVGRSAWVAHGSFFAIASAVSFFAVGLALFLDHEPLMPLAAVGLALIIDVSVRLVGIGVLSARDTSDLRHTCDEAARTTSDWTGHLR